ncbi:Ubiquitin receptor RAD23 (DNA repair protein RAD23) [Psidium guajava]|nr:Ubiquitin receptor RAD23 (DNA repair protein RAD23) [Psidium guajava]
MRQLSQSRTLNSFGHLIASLASWYTTMLLTGWSTSVGESGKSVDGG